METDINELIDKNDATGLAERLAAGWDPNSIRGMESPLSRAAAKGSEAVVELLLAHGALPDAPLVWPSPLVLAVEAGAAGIVEKLLAAGADVGSEPWHDDADLPLVAAFFAKQYKIVEILIAHGAVEAADERWLDEMLMHALQGKGRAAKSALVALLARLLECFEGRMIPISQGYLQKAASILGREASTRELAIAIQERVDVTRAALDRVGDWAEDVAEERGTASELLVIVEEAPKEARPQVAAAAFYAALRLRELEEFKDLPAAIFDMGIDINFLDQGRTPLMEAARKGQVNFVSRLISLGADIRAVEPGSGYAVVDFAEGSADPETIAVIHKALRASSREFDSQADLRLQRLDPAEQAQEKIRLAVEAAAERRWDRVEALVAQGADVNGTGHGRRSLATYAAQQVDQDRIRWLAARGATFEGRDAQGMTPLMHARFSEPDNATYNLIKELMKRSSEQH